MRWRYAPHLRQTAAAAGVAIAGGTLWATAPAAARARRSASGRRRSSTWSISCQENRSFDHYFGYAPQVQAAGLGPPPGYTQPDAAGVGHAPFELTALRSVDPPHGWNDVHAQYNGGKMDGFYRNAAARTGNGNNAMPYYTANGSCRSTTASSATPASARTTSARCSGRPGRTASTSCPGRRAGITTNGLWGYGIFDSASWPIILDLLDDAEVSWKIYYIGSDGVEVGDTDNVAVFWSRWAHDPRTTATLDDYLEDCRRGTLPNVSWIIPSFSMQFDEHPDADVSVGMGFQEQIINALRHSPPVAQVRVLPHLRRARWLLRPRPAAAGRRVRARDPGAALGHLAVSRGAGPILSRKPADHVSTLKFIERLWGLPTLASRNHTFDVSTPTGGNYQAGGAPAPPRDGLAGLSDLFDLFDF